MKDDILIDIKFDENFIEEKEEIKINIYFKQLMEIVLLNSASKDWKVAVYEWDIIGYNEVEENEELEKCVCGNEGLRKLFTIKNRENKRILFPIGSTCIKRFDREDLNSDIKIIGIITELKRMFNNNEIIVFDSKLFSKKLIEYLYIKKAFKPNKYNNFNPKNDYEFLLKMFNNKKKITDNQNKKIIALILNSIRPFLKSLEFIK